MNIGDMNAQIDIIDVQLTRDPMGGNVETESVIFPGVWCNVLSKPGGLGGTTVYQSKQKEAHVQYILTIRYRTGVSPLMRVMKGNEKLLITRINDVNNKHEWIELYCQGLKNSGV